MVQGIEFHTDGPAAEKARRAVVLNRQRGTTRTGEIFRVRPSRLEVRSQRKET